MRNIPRLVVAMGVALLPFFLVCEGVFAESELEQKDIVVSELSSIQNDNPDFRIRLKPVSKTGRKFYIGDQVTFEVRSNKDAYLTLIDVGTSGKAHVIFPKIGRASCRERV